MERIWSIPKPCSILFFHLDWTHYDLFRSLFALSFVSLPRCRRGYMYAGGAYGKNLPTPSNTDPQTPNRSNPPPPPSVSVAQSFLFGSALQIDVKLPPCSN
ncbi:hypothetical protein TB2_014227 [Malus domestica]